MPVAAPSRGDTLVLVPDGVACASLAPRAGVTLVRYSTGSEAEMVPVARGVRAVPPGRVLAAGPAQPLSEPVSGASAIRWAVRANLLPDRATADHALVASIAQRTGVPAVGAVATAAWLDAGDGDERARLARITGATLENPASFALLSACAGAGVPGAMIAAVDIADAIDALARFLDAE